MATIIFVWISTVNNDVLVHSISELIAQQIRQLTTHIEIACHILEKFHLC